MMSSRLARACLSLLVCGLGFLALCAAPALAQSAAPSTGVMGGLQAVGSTIVLPANDPRVIAAHLINVALSFVAIVMLAIMLYAGFLWMTSGGEAAKVEQAQKYIRNAIIGLIIILSSWAITQFVIRQLLGATGEGTGGVISSGPGGSGGTFGSTGGALGFQIRSMSPAGRVSLRNVEVQVWFTQAISAVSAHDHVHVNTADGRAVEGAVSTDGAVVTFVPNASCGGTSPERHCFDGNTDFVIHIDTQLLSASGRTLSCGGGFAPPCDGRFHTGTLVDTTPPAIAISAPFDGQSLPQRDRVHVRAHATDDTGISSITGMVDGTDIGRDAPTTGTSPLSFDGDILWMTPATTGTHAILTRARDLDSNQASSFPVNVMIRPQHCFNHVQDADESGVDCGGSCGACAGATCHGAAECASAVCTGGVCVEAPIITGYSPRNGRPGTLLTIVGLNFGVHVGHVYVGGVAATAPPMCDPAQSWTQNQIIVAVPATATTGSIQVVHADNGLSDTLEDARGPRLPRFLIDTTARPGVCAAVPTHGLTGSDLRLTGIGLGTGGTVLFDEREITSVNEWADDHVRLNVPVVSSGLYGVGVRSGAAESNRVGYHVDDAVTQAPPIIDSMSPDHGQSGEYITLSGSNFGAQVGSVLFVNAASHDAGPAGLDFPAVCGTLYWHDASVTVKVPTTVGGLRHALAVGENYQVVLIRADGVRSDPVGFHVSNDPLHPGICALDPSVGPVSTRVRILGERFGSTGRVTFAARSGRVDGSVGTGAWSDGEVRTNVPSAGVTGQVRVETGGSISNNVPFQVQNCQSDAQICLASGLVCCADGSCARAGDCPLVSTHAEYAWRTSTGQLSVAPEVIEECPGPRGLTPSPSPWLQRDGTVGACVNAVIGIRFNTLLNPATVTSENISIQKCTAADAGGADPCSATSPVAGELRLFDVGDHVAHWVRFTPSGGTFDPHATYDVLVRANVESATHVSMRAQNRFGSGLGYRFRFKTRASTVPCKIGYVSLSPGAYTMTDIGQTEPYQANGLSADDVCTMLDTSRIGWRWSTGDTRADITNTLVPATALVADNQTATGRQETGSVPVVINAQTTYAVPPNPLGSSSLFIRPTPPRVVEYGPNCQQACSNGKLWATFNVSMDVARVTAANIVLRHCLHEDCSAFDGPPGGLVLSAGDIRFIDEPGHTRLQIEPRNRALAGGPSYLQPGQFYRVILRGGAGGLRGSNGLLLSELNDADGFAWKFRVKSEGDGRCATDHVDVIPGNKIEHSVGSMQAFFAQPVAANGVCGQQPLIQDRDFAWSVEDPSVAILIHGDGTPGQSRLADRLPPGCSNQCLKSGASGVSGHVATCGDGVVQTITPSYCVPRGDAPAATDCHADGAPCATPFGDRCQLLQAGSTGNEECDYGALNGTPGSLCTSQCLWAGTVAPTCGDGHLDAGEECDVGKTCTHGDVGKIGTTCTAAAACGAHGTCELIERAGCSTNCLALGATAGGTTCGNNDIGPGKTCDDGNGVSGDGCSSQCLAEGSQTQTAICGNGRIEPGETCEARVAADGTRVWPIGCDTHTCLHTGVDPCVLPPGDVPRSALPAQCCGNGNPAEPGKDCDLGPGLNVIGSGCSPRCLSEGASLTALHPSLCRDGNASESGKQCDAASGATYLVSPFQIAQITALRDPTDAENHQLRTEIRADYDAKRGVAIYGLQCGLTQESACNADHSYLPNGLSAGGCCALRPLIIDRYPPASPPGNRNVCRNTLISITFNQLMDEASIRTNVLVATSTSATACPAGTTPVALSVDTLPTHWYEWFGYAARQLSRFFSSHTAEAQVWCVGSIPGSLRLESVRVGTTTTTRATFLLQHALAPLTEYRIYVHGDNDLARGVRDGVRSARGVAMNGGVMWTFQTGAQICAANQISIEDLSHTTDFLFTHHPEAHTYGASAASIREDGSVAPIVPVAEYDWTWRPWLAAHRNILNVAAGTSPGPDQSRSDISEQNLNGSSYVTASLAISHDDSVPSSAGTVVASDRNTNVMLCRHPWPKAAGIAGYEHADVFADAPNSPLLAGTPIEHGPFYYFSTLYCLDAQPGVASDQADLPVMRLKPTPISPADLNRGIVRQYFFVFEDPNYRADGIGIRVASNPQHLSPQAWYLSQGFTGAPQALTIDGYPAIQDGTTLYVAATRVNDAGTQVESFIYLISHNPNPSAAAQNIYDQLVRNWTFNTNLSTDAEDVCKNGSAYVTDANHQVVACTADWECADAAPGAHCASLKEKLQRDVQRISDFQDMSAALETTYVHERRYPPLTTGTFLTTLANSRWPGWQHGLAQAVHVATLPEDPVNRFLTCGRCQRQTGGTRPLGLACVDSSECPDGQSCVPLYAGAAAADGFDPTTCWSAARKLFMCPRLESSDASPLVSHVYQYQALNGGERYQLSMELEGPTNYVPSLPSEIKRCDNTKQVCQLDTDCRVVGGSGTIVSTGHCLGTGGRWLYGGHDACPGTPISQNDVCAVGVRGPGQACALAETRLTTCALPGGGTGTKNQTCSNCTGWVDAPGAACQAVTTCGNGVLEKYRCMNVHAATTPSATGLNEGRLCHTLSTDASSASAECESARDPAGVLMQCVSVTRFGGHEEICDDGPLNGTYGHCNRTCSGYDRYCGNGVLDAGKLCDNGHDGPNRNTDYCAGQTDNCPDPANACSLDCHSRPAYCGDHIVNGPEECDGNTDQTGKAICSNGEHLGTPCDTNADCGAGGACGVVPGVSHVPDSDVGRYVPCGSVNKCAGGGTRNGNSCATDTDCVDGVLHGRCIAYPTFHTRDCGAPNESNACRWNAWSECHTSATCGNGVLDPGEECDNGPANGSGSCTSDCKLNVCGSGEPWPGVKECDYGRRPASGAVPGRMYNGDSCQNADYGSTCSACSTTCHLVAGSGGFCGDGVKDGPEQCDGRDGVTPDLTCRALGYDYSSQISCAHRTFTSNPDGGQLHTDALSCCTTDGHFGTWTHPLAWRGPAAMYSMSIVAPPSTGIDVGRFMSPGIDALRSDATHISPFMGSAPVVGSGAMPSRPPLISSSITCLPTDEVGVCVTHPASLTTPDRIPSAAASACTSPVHDAIACNASCTFSGCARCQDTPGTGQIAATVLDAVYHVGVPGARVTLYFRGARLGETYTAPDGSFHFDHVNERAECGLYRIIVDFYSDNPNTPHHNESRNGGYWPFESGTFQVSTFASDQTESVMVGGKSTAVINLFPRTGPNEVLVYHSWDWNHDDPAAQNLEEFLFLPAARAFGAASADDHTLVPRTWQFGASASERVGNRAITNWIAHAGQMVVSDPTVFPYAGLSCPADTSPQHLCPSSATPPPRIIRYRSSVNGETTGRFQYFIWDDAFIGGASGSSNLEYLQRTNQKVFVITHDHFYRMSLPLIAISSCPTQMFWHVYDQAVDSGEIQIANEFLCSGAPMPGPGAVGNFPLDLNSPLSNEDRPPLVSHDTGG